MLVLPGVRIQVPPNATMTIKEGGDARRIPVKGLGHITHLHLITPQVLEVQLEGEGEAGEYLVAAIKQGKAIFELLYTGPVLEGRWVNVPLRMGIRWLDDAAHGVWLFKLNQGSLLLKDPGERRREVAEQIDTAAAETVADITATRDAALRANAEAQQAIQREIDAAGPAGPDPDRA